jgi:uncharacterized protein YbcC (UPF0753/DUF2309 family)
MTLRTRTEPSSVTTDPVAYTTKFIIGEVCRRMPPLWPLKSFVAVNPFLGYSDLHFLEAAAKIRRVAHGDILMPESYYQEQIDQGNITDTDIRSAIESANQTVPAPWLSEIKPLDLPGLRNRLEVSRKASGPRTVLSFGDFIDAHLRTKHLEFLVDEVSKWCSVYFDEGQSSWRMPWRNRPLYTAWREAALIDANPRLNGWKYFKSTVGSMPEEPYEVIEHALLRLECPVTSLEEFLHRQLVSIAGWSSYVQYRVRELRMHGQEDDSLVDLLAVRLVYDLALLAQFESDEIVMSRWRGYLVDLQQYEPQTDLLPRYLAQLALEHNYQQGLLANLKEVPIAEPTVKARKQLQAVFCIDVRSEVFRRALEHQSDAIETFGFAGFFGMPIEYIRFGERQGSSQCPVLLTPKYSVRETLPGPAENEERLRHHLRLKKRITHAWNAFKTSAISCFSFVETSGLYFGLRLAQDGLAYATPEASPGPSCRGLDFTTEGHPHQHEAALSLQTQADLAEGALRNLGLTSDFGRLVLICGHGSQTKNNPYASGLDCGACGGNAGDANARVAVAILNNEKVRSLLQGRGIIIPTDCRCIAGLHNTTTDHVILYDSDQIPASHQPDLAQLREWLNGASKISREERAPALGLSPESPHLEEQVLERSRDWAQVRPEWGLAGNAAFNVAPRERTKRINFHGRVFLHNYDAEKDPTGSILELIMTAPLVVTNWINLQYYASTVNNQLYGSGNKTIHNVVGVLGVWQGNGGDLQMGLPMQSLHDGKRWMHQPLRLSVVIEASRESIEQVLLKHANIRELVRNEWLHLFALENGGASSSRYLGMGRWAESGSGKQTAEISNYHREERGHRQQWRDDRGVAASLTGRPVGQPNEGLTARLLWAQH